MGENGMSGLSDENGSEWRNPDHGTRIDIIRECLEEPLSLFVALKVLTCRNTVLYGVYINALHFNFKFYPLSYKLKKESYTDPSAFLIKKAFTNGIRSITSTPKLLPQATGPRPATL